MTDGQPTRRIAEDCRDVFCPEHDHRLDRSPPRPRHTRFRRNIDLMNGIRFGRALVFRRRMNMTMTSSGQMQYGGGTLMTDPTMAPKPSAPSPTTPPALDAEGRAQMKRWLENWRVVGPILEKERWDRVEAMTDQEAQRASQRVLELWRPGWHGDDGEELLLHQRVFARARR